MRVLHIGDIHLDNEWLGDTHEALWNATGVAQQEQCDVAIIPGDVFDSRSTPLLRSVLVSWLEVLMQTVKAVVICRGNHDARYDLDFLRLDKRITVSDTPDRVLVHNGNEPLMIYVLPWPNRAYVVDGSGLTGENALMEAQTALRNVLVHWGQLAKESDTPSILTGHVSVAGALASTGQPLCGREIQAVAEDLSSPAFSYVGLNHIHRHQSLADGRVVYAGDLIIRNHGEENEAKGVVVADVPKDGGRAEWRFVPFTPRPWCTIEAYIEDGNVVESGAPDNPAGHVIRYRYSCKEDEVSLFDLDEVERRFSEAERLKFDPQIERTDRTRGQEVAAAASPREKLLAWAESVNVSVPETALEDLDEIVRGLED